MEAYDPSSMILTYNLVIGILIMLASPQLASFAGRIGPRLARYTQVSSFTFGAAVAALHGTLSIVFLVTIGIEN